jgi:hypothetical protein
MEIWTIVPLLVVPTVFFLGLLKTVSIIEAK